MIDALQSLPPELIRALLAGQMRTRPQQAFQRTGVDALGRPQYGTAQPQLSPFGFARRTTPDILGKGAGIDPRMYTAAGEQPSAAPRPDILADPFPPNAFGGDPRMLPANWPAATPRPDILAGGYDPRTFSQRPAAANPDILAGADDRRFAQQPAMANPDILAAAGDARREPTLSDAPTDPEASAFAPRPAAQTLSARPRLPLPRARPAAVAPAAQGGFAGPSGPQWNDAQYQAWWDRAQGTP